MPQDVPLTEGLARCVFTEPPMGGVCHPKLGLTTPETKRHDPLRGTGLQHKAETAKHGGELSLSLVGQALSGR